MIFALLRSVAWASSRSRSLAPDEDYHWVSAGFFVAVVAAAIACFIAAYAVVLKAGVTALARRRQLRA